MVTINKNIGTQTAEQGLLSQLFYKPDKIVEIIDELNPDLFSVKEFSVVYKCIFELWKEGIIPDEVTVINRAANLGYSLTPELVKKLANATTFVTKRQLKQYCEIIKLHAFKRKSTSLLEDFLENSKNSNIQTPEKFSGELLDLAVQLQDKIKSENNTSAISVDKDELKDDLKFRFDNPGYISGIPFGFSEIDEYIDGAEEGDIITIGGMNGSCKSYFSAQVMINMAKWLLKNRDDRKLLFISLEMTKKKVNNRLISIISGINSKYFKKPRLYFIDNNIPATQENFDKFLKYIDRASDILNKLPIIIDDSSSLSADQVCGIIKKVHLKENVACTFIDHTGMITNEGLDDYKSYEYSYSRFMQTAKNTGVPIISLMQYLKSQKENRADGYRPTLFDIRGGKSAQDASMKILHMYKPDIHIDYINKHPELRNKIYVLNDKNRDGDLMPDIELQFYNGNLKQTLDIMAQNMEVVKGFEDFNEKN